MYSIISADYIPNVTCFLSILSILFCLFDRINPPLWCLKGFLVDCAPTFSLSSLESRRL